MSLVDAIFLLLPNNIGGRILAAGAKFSMSRATLQISTLVVLSLLPTLLRASPVVLDFEAVSDLEPVTTQFPPLTFSNAIALTAAISLNEFEFPPASGTVVISDDVGPIIIEFGVPVMSFSGFFTYLVPLTLEAFDSTDTLVVSAFSAFSSNLALSGEPGSSPNELLAVAFGGGISRVTITGDSFGSSFTLDNATTTTVPVPEPSTLWWTLLGAGLIIARMRKKIIHSSF